MSSLTCEKEELIKNLENQLGLARREINNLRKQLKALTFIQQKEYDKIKNVLQSWRCLGCKTQAESPPIASEKPPSTNTEIKMQNIGVIRTQFPEKRGTPRQPTICSDSVAKLSLNDDVFTNPDHTLQGLQDFSHMWILFHFHKNKAAHKKAKVAPPRLNGERTGVFASRSPHRPNPIGLSLVKIDKIEGSNVYFSGVDVVDETPVLDIKPYIPQYDTPEDHVRVPHWIGNSTVKTLRVVFEEIALVQLNDYKTDGRDVKADIEKVLREDPRSVYLRAKWTGHYYTFRMCNLQICCKFDDESHTVTVHEVTACNDK
ncbi:tRNA (adenine(37)-N6)-methyltransferase [Tribolium castaneum]|uniref:Nef-associated protein 1-like Protein n=1 Tax=Tribolium castaneum TaxID=7070 RepID=D6WQW9_TRICA|nr:PREDICTED: tRNA (adenine(37)-N6)-methyltransferase [Tribolium castaneum]EFA07644.2 Nef-associated protein 1-like Protein [Tribolium castaneum]|eukprot:XP_967755.1 PREDICTED: tRNA (adenine(37)-N6)-methyltransferase [Tribolium castaneum]